MTTALDPAAAARNTSLGPETLGQLLAEHDRLQVIWQSSRSEPDRLAMVACWSVVVTAPGWSPFSSERPGPGATRRASPALIQGGRQRRVLRRIERPSCFFAPGTPLTTGRRNRCCGCLAGCWPWKWQFLLY